MRATDDQIAYTLILIKEHEQRLHEVMRHRMCRLCHPEEAKLLDQLGDEDE